MYITYVNGRFCASESAENAVVELLPPRYREEGREYVLEGGEDAANRVDVTVEQVNAALFRIRRRWTNTADSVRRIQTIQAASPVFAVENYLIPCVSVNGNTFGNGLEPKGLTREGKPWIFAYDREAIPSCTLTQNADFACALFASAADARSLESACSVSVEDGRWVQSLFHPVIEQPVTYSTRDGYGPGYETFLTLAPGECWESEMYLSVSRPRWKNFGIAEVLDQALDLYGANADMAVPEARDLWERSMAFARSLISDYKGHPGFYIGWTADGRGGFRFRGDPNFELAWCGQNVLFCRMFIEDWARFGRRGSLDTALAILDARVKLCTAESGLLAAQLRSFENLNEAKADTCNMGYGAYELLRCWERLTQLGIERPAYLDAARGFCDFFCAHFSPDFGFGKEWRLDGVCTSEGGSIGAFVICPLAKLYALTGEEKYLKTAEKAMKFYVERDLDRFCCTAGALDTSCVDKETSAPFLMSAVLLYEATQDPVYLTYAEKAATYFTAWMYHFEPIYPAESEFSRYGVRIQGLTAVSAQHHHVDMYGGIVVPYFRRLAELTGDARWRVRGDMLWRAVTQCIGDGKLVIHGVVRPVGSQNEALYQCRWAFHNSDRGRLNDWLVAWPCAFRMSVLAEEF